LGLRFQSDKSGLTSDIPCLGCRCDSIAFQILYTIITIFHVLIPAALAEYRVHTYLITKPFCGPPGPWPVIINLGGFWMHPPGLRIPYTPSHLQLSRVFAERSSLLCRCSSAESLQKGQAYFADADQQSLCRTFRLEVVHSDLKLLPH
jgi:hypothetical protein